MPLYLKGCRHSELEWRPEESQLQRLSRWANIYGDFKVSYSFKDKEGIHHFSKHRSVLTCMESSWGRNFLQRANHRQILPIEFVIDLDDNPTKEKFNDICNLLRSANEVFYGYFTGSKGYHIHIFTYELIGERYKDDIRKELAEMLNADLLKTSDNVMIAMENKPHWKTGNKKELINYG